MMLLFNFIIWTGCSHDHHPLSSPSTCTLILCLLHFYFVSDIFAIAVGSVSTLDEYTESGEFYRTYSQLTRVPMDIPDEAKEVYLYGNQITEVKRGSFSRLQNCTKVDVGTNTIVTIEMGAFKDLARSRRSTST